VAIENARLYAEVQERVNELAVALQQRRELDRLKDEFIQNTSHELRTPLALILGHAELLEAGELGEVPREQIQSIEVISRRARDLRLLVEGLLTVLEVETGSITLYVLSLQDLIEQATGDFQAAARKAGLHLSVEIKVSPLPQVRGDERLLRRALDNLIANAIKFTPDKGSV